MQYSSIRRRNAIRETERHLAATNYHESGHAVCGLFLGADLYEVRSWHGECVFETDAYNRLSAFDRVTIGYGGAAAARRAGLDEGDAGDRAIIAEIVKQHPTVDRDKARGRAEAIISEFWPAVETLANALRHCGDLSGRDIVEIVRGVMPLRTRGPEELRYRDGVILPPANARGDKPEPPPEPRLEEFLASPYPRRRRGSGAYWRGPF